MNSRAVLVWSLLAAFTTPSVAQEATARIELDEAPGARVDLAALAAEARSGPPKIVLARVSFLSSDPRRCPEDSGVLQISGGTLAQRRMAMLADPEGQGSFNGWRSTMSPIDDQTFQYRVALPDCRMDVAIRHQIRRDGVWTSELLGREQRPSVPLEERRTLERQRLDLERQERDKQRARFAKILGRDEKKMVDVRPGYYQEIGTTRSAFFFDGAAPKCFKASGPYQVERTGIVFSFAITKLPGFVAGRTGVPDDPNRFVIERSDPDENHSRLQFTRGDCRWELTIGQSVLRNGEWHAVPLSGQRQLRL